MLPAVLRRGHGRRPRWWLRWWPPSARGRLTLLLTALVLAAGAALTTLTYLLMRRPLSIRLVSLPLRPPATADGGRPPAAEPPGLPDAPDLAEVSGRTEDALLSELLRQAPIALAAVTLLTAALGWLVAGRMLRPIRTIAATARRLSAEHLSERVPVRPPADELAALAGTVNGMLDRIQAGVARRDRVLDSQRLFTANAAHELRTPLATIRAAVDVTLDGEPSRAELLTMATDIRTAAAHSQRTLDGLLALAHSEAGPRERRRTDLARLSAALLDDAAERAAARGLALRPTLRAAPAAGEPILLERLARNLLDNALRYNHPGGHVALATGTDGAHAVLRIANTGPVLAAETTGRLLDPFVRGDTGTDPDADGDDRGAGLGLSIVRAVVLAHRGALTLEPRPAGGLEITVRLPGHGLPPG